MKRTMIKVLLRGKPKEEHGEPQSGEPANERASLYFKRGAARYLKHVDDALKSRVPLAAWDLLALQSLSESEDSTGLAPWKVLLSSLIVAVTAIFLVLGMRTAPITEIVIHTIAPEVSISLADKKVPGGAEFAFYSTIEVPAAEISLSGTADVDFVSTPTAPGRGIFCPVVKLNKPFIVRRPTLENLIASAGSKVTLSASGTDTAGSASSLEIEVDGALLLTARLPASPSSTERSQDCQPYIIDDIRPEPTHVKFHADQGTISSLVISMPSGQKAIHVLRPTMLMAKAVEFETSIFGASQNRGGTWTRCATKSETVYFRQTGWFGVERIDRKELALHDCVRFDGKASDVSPWNVQLEPDADGYFEVSQRISDPAVIGHLYIDGPLAGSHLGESYLAILWNDPTLLLAIAVSTAVITNLWSVAQLAKAWFP
jgi:hypothetical protein